MAQKRVEALSETSAFQQARVYLSDHKVHSVLISNISGF